jgi:hypothetical protein
MTKADRRWWFNSPAIAGYAVAVGSVGAALAGSQWLDVHAATAPVSLFLCAIMFSAWFGGGFGPVYWRLYSQFWRSITFMWLRRTPL